MGFSLIFQPKYGKFKKFSVFTNRSLIYTDNNRNKAPGIYREFITDLTRT